MSDTELRVYRFHPDGLDPVTVYVEQHRPGAGRMTVQCYAQAWTAYWGSMGDERLEDFVIDCSADYIADNLTWGINGSILKSRQKHLHDYVVRIVNAIQSEFRK